MSAEKFEQTTLEKLIEAAYKKNYCTVKALVESEKDGFLINLDGKDAIHLLRGAAYDLTILSYLASNGLDVNTLGPCNMTALHVLAENDTKGRSVNVENSEEKAWGAIENLISLGAQTEIKETVDGYKPSQLVRKEILEEAAKENNTLVKRTIDVILANPELAAQALNRKPESRIFSDTIIDDVILGNKYHWVDKFKGKKDQEKNTSPEK